MLPFCCKFKLIVSRRNHQNPPNSTDGAHLKGCDHDTATHTVALLPGTEITVKGGHDMTRGKCIPWAFYEKYDK
eukprot:1917442-Ditylum_brightwellii.AAC.1